ncbi:MAG TPA: polyprenyl synthetase family protein, partial [Alphaproteobacteria bacterium]|nr:polyprenyl synthetase family protein [Alphaproteobacteria bacterium]
MQIPTVAVPVPAKGPTLQRSRFELDLAALCGHVDRRLDDLLNDLHEDGNALHLAMRDAALAPGKRLRPLIVLLAGRDLGCASPALVDAGCALELVHAASLVLDDLPCMDDATLRRGRPATHIRFGQDVAVLAAIGLLSRAFAVLAALPATPGRRAALSAMLAEAIGPAGLVGGQYADLRPGALSAAARIADTNRLKTGALFAAGTGMAAEIAGAGLRQRRLLQDFSAEFGQAFQLLDDLLDGEATAAALGKDVGQDAGKATLVAALGARAARAALKDHLDRA